MSTTATTEDWRCFNLNCRASVTLTDTGYDRLKKHLLSRSAGRLFAKETRALESGVFVTQLWRLMEIFGGVVSMGSEPPFKDNVISLEARS